MWFHKKMSFSIIINQINKYTDNQTYMLIFRHIFLSNYWWQKSDIWSQASYWYPISWEAFLDPSDSYFLFADFVDFYTHLTYMHIFRHIFLSNYWWQRSDIWSQASYRYTISWEAFFDPSDSYFLFAKERGYHRWALAHSSSCLVLNDNHYKISVCSNGTSARWRLKTVNENFTNVDPDWHGIYMALYKETLVQMLRKYANYIVGVTKSRVCRY
jgi:hypothetical protein